MQGSALRFAGQLQPKPTMRNLWTFLTVARSTDPMDRVMLYVALACYIVLASVAELGL